MTSRGWRCYLHQQPAVFAAPARLLWPLCNQYFPFFFISFSLLQTIVSLLLILCFFRWCRDVHLKKNETRFVFNSLYYYFDFFSLARFLLLSFLVFISWKVILTDTETIHPWLYYIYFYFLWCSSHQALFWWRNMLHYHKDYDSRNSLDTAH